MNRCLEKTNIPESMTIGKTTLIQQDPSVSIDPEHAYQIWEEIHNSLISYGLFFEEQKGFRKRTRGTGELLYIDQHILQESKTRRKNLAMVWIYDKKVYDMVPQSWIVDGVKMYKTPDKVIKFYRGNHEKLGYVIDSRWKKFNWSKNPERYALERSPFNSSRKFFQSSVKF